MFTKYIIGFKYFDKEIEVFHSRNTIEVDWVEKKNQRIIFLTEDCGTMGVDMDSLAFVTCTNIKYKWDNVKEKFVLPE